jgi:hypothetical protein
MSTQVASETWAPVTDCRSLVILKHPYACRIHCLWRILDSLSTCSVGVAPQIRVAFYRYEYIISVSTTHENGMNMCGAVGLSDCNACWNGIGKLRNVPYMPRTVFAA